ncbi:MAG: hypothetical protein ACI4WG_04205 [Erysipelotrichaceae bacterium]
MKNYLVEIFDEDYLENIISIVHRRYDGIYLICEKQQQVKNLSVFLENHFNCFCRIINYDMGNIDSIRQAIESFLNSEDSFDFDLTGGEQCVILVLGQIMVQNKHHIQIHKYDVIKDKLTYSSESAALYDNEDCSSLIKDIIGLNGGKVISGENYDYQEKGFRSEVIRLFDLLRKINNDFNRFCNLTTEKVDRLIFRKYIESESEKKSAYNVLLEFKKHNIITDYQLLKEESRLFYQYEFAKEYTVKDLFFKGGTCLEIYGALAFYETGYFNDIHNSVLIDLDGKVTKNSSDPYNEVDIMMLYRHTPVFVSCKNTRVNKEYLYEISTIAKQYGGKYAVAVILSTVKALSPVSNRAKQMGIMLIDDIANYSLTELKEEIVTRIEEQYGKDSN